MEAKKESVKCQICGREVSLEEIYDWSGLKICEDCYFEKSSPVKTCDPWAVYSAKKFIETAGVKAEENLTETQKAIYNLVKSKERITVEELSRELNVSRRELETQIAILRHLELIKGRKEGDKIYIVPFKNKS